TGLGSDLTRWTLALASRVLDLEYVFRFRNTTDVKAMRFYRQQEELSARQLEPVAMPDGTLAAVWGLDRAFSLAELEAGDVLYCKPEVVNADEFGMSYRLPEKVLLPEPNPLSIKALSGRYFCRFILQI
ncbi:hypothetical protein RZS08_37705, partial [Arthrospira platensis SPKY1]|nr:hypothetical protein [Arthrospira platensis SPKY1]